MNKEQIQQKIDKNREEIHKLLYSDFPLELLYIRVNMLTAQNLILIEKLNKL